MTKFAKTAALSVVALGFAAGGYALADAVRDWKDFDRVHKHIVESINEMERARAANHYDLAGHGVKAEQLLRDAEKEVALGIEAIRKSP